MTNFKQAVSMPCNKQEYMRDLKEPLEKMGYKREGAFKWDECRFFMTCPVDNGCMYPNQTKGSNRLYHIPEYNPSLFLAIAAMREGEQVHVGEWLYCVKNPYDSRHHSSGDIFVNTCTESYINKEFLRKATLSELITHFTKKDMIYTLEDLREGKVACVNDGTKEEIRNVLGFVFPKDNYGVIGATEKYYYAKTTQSWTFGDTTKLPTQSVKLFYNQLPKETMTTFKFGDKVRCWGEGMGTKDTVRFIAYKGGNNPYVVTDLDYFDNLMEDKLTSVCSFQYCEPYPQPLKIKRSEILQKFNCEDFIIED